MLKMSFYNGSLDREKLIEFVKNTNKEIRYTYGFTYRHPTTCRVPISVEKAIEIIKTQSYLDADELEDYVHLNAYSDNDMF